jgi:hypothetical protein
LQGDIIASQNYPCQKAFFDSNNSIHSLKGGFIRFRIQWRRQRFETGYTEFNKGEGA